MSSSTLRLLPSRLIMASRVFSATLLAKPKVTKADNASPRFVLCDTAPIAAASIRVFFPKFIFQFQNYSLGRFSPNSFYILNGTHIFPHNGLLDFRHRQRRNNH